MFVLPDVIEEELRVFTTVDQQGANTTLGSLRLDARCSHLTPNKNKFKIVFSAEEQKCCFNSKTRAELQSMLQQQQTRHSGSKLYSNSRSY